MGERTDGAHAEVPGLSLGRHPRSPFAPLAKRPAQPPLAHSALVLVSPLAGVFSFDLAACMKPFCVKQEEDAVKFLPLPG